MRREHVFSNVNSVIFCHIQSLLSESYCFTRFIWTKSGCRFLAGRVSSSIILASANLNRCSVNIFHRLDDYCGLGNEKQRKGVSQILLIEKEFLTIQAGFSIFVQIDCKRGEKKPPSTKSGPGNTKSEMAHSNCQCSYRRLMVTNFCFVFVFEIILSLLYSWKMNINQTWKMVRP